MALAILFIMLCLTILWIWFSSRTSILWPMICSSGWGSSSMRSSSSCRCLYDWRGEDCSRTRAFEWSLCDTVVWEFSFCIWLSLNLMLVNCLAVGLYFFRFGSRSFGFLETGPCFMWPPKMASRGSLRPLSMPLPPACLATIPLSRLLYSAVYLDWCIKFALVISALSLIFLSMMAFFLFVNTSGNSIDWCLIRAPTSWCRASLNLLCFIVRFRADPCPAAGELCAATLFSSWSRSLNFYDKRANYSSLGCVGITSSPDVLYRYECSFFSRDVGCWSWLMMN